MPTTGDNSLLHSPVINALRVLHEQGCIPIFNYEIRLSKHYTTKPATMYRSLRIQGNEI